MKVFALVGIPFAAGMINFVVLTAAASACNSGIFANSRTLFGLSDRKQAPPKLQATNRKGVPVVAILVTCALLLFAVLLNYFIPNATTVFVYISTVSTVLNIFIWTIIMIAYVRYTKARPDLHKQSRYKMPGGKIMSICIIAFFVFIFGVLFVNPETRIGVILAPLWLIVLALMYRQYKKHTAE